MKVQRNKLVRRTVLAGLALPLLVLAAGCGGGGGGEFDETAMINTHQAVYDRYPSEDDVDWLRERCTEDERRAVLVFAIMIDEGHTDWAAEYLTVMEQACPDRTAKILMALSS